MLLEYDPGMYDRILRTYASKLGKPFGAIAGTADIATSLPVSVHALDITQPMRENLRLGPHR